MNFGVRYRLGYGDAFLFDIFTIINGTLKTNMYFILQNSLKAAMNKNIEDLLLWNVWYISNFVILQVQESFRGIRKKIHITSMQI